MYAMTAASPILPIPCYVRVTNLDNGKQVIVKVNDRGPFAPNRIIDLSYVAALKLGYQKKGTALVRVSSINLGPHYAQSSAPKLYLQLGAFGNYQNARSAVSHARRLTFEPVMIVSTHSLYKPLYKVQIGPLHGVGESDNLLKRLTLAGFRQAFTIIN